MGIYASLTGKHADIVITDDIVNIKDRVSRAEREKTKLQYQELQNVKNRGGRFINTGRLGIKKTPSPKCLTSRNSIVTKQD